jgi:hypothetical protein
MWLLDGTGTAEPGLLRDAAQLARYASDFESVARLATALIRFDPGAGPRMMLGEALYELGRFGAADATLRDAAEAASDDDEYLLATVLRTQSLAFAALRLDDAMAVNADARRKLTSRPAQDALRVDQIALLSFGSEVARATSLLATLGDAADPRTRVMGAIPMPTRSSTPAGSRTRSRWPTPGTLSTWPWTPSSPPPTRACN